MTTNNADILIIDDNESDTLLMQEAIKDAEFTSDINIIHEAKDALDYLNKKGEYKNATRPDLILLDLKMPDFDGHEFLKVVKQDPKLARIPIIILTTSADPKDVELSYELQANCFILKPVNFMKFKKVVSVIKSFWLGIATLPPKTE